MDLFTSDGSRSGIGVPLAARMRPRSVDEVVGQQHVLAESSPLRALLGSDRAGASIVFWGPPGTGKTTLARVIANTTGSEFKELSAVSATVKDVRAVIAAAKLQRETGGRRTVLFVDEVHRFSKTQQDALLPAVENGWVTLVGATTENPSFSVIPALLSRSLVLPLRPLADQDLETLIDRALAADRGLGGSVSISSEASEHLIRIAGGDARRALTLLETAAGSVLARNDESPAASPQSTDSAGLLDGAASNPARSGAGPTAGGTAGAGAGSASSMVPGPFDEPTAGTTSVDPAPQTTQSVDLQIKLADIEAASMHAAPRYDRAGDRHYDVASALIKSLRGSDVDAALHYLAVMIEAGEDPRFIARRLMILASEDIGMADPTALTVATMAHTAVSSIGMPEARIILAQATVHLALAPKSNAAYKAIDAALADVRAGRTGPVPDPLRDGSTKSARQDGASIGYKYPHDEPAGVSVQQYAPDVVADAIYYRPTNHGAEARSADTVHRLRAILRASGR